MIALITFQVVLLAANAVWVAKGIRDNKVAARG